MATAKGKISSSVKISYGVTAFMLVDSYALCICAVLGLGLHAAFFSTVSCLLISLALNKKVLAPDAFLTVPLIFAFSGGAKSGFIAVGVGSLLFFIISRLAKGKKLPDYTIAGASLGLALAATILLTNNYFGIGAFGDTSWQMLKTYRSLGFHPNFRGLLYGTITLFLMITYPFKFKKLNRIIPAEFVTLFLPTVINLFLNPDSTLTTVNEAAFSLSGAFPAFNNLEDFSAPVILRGLEGAVSVALILFGYTTKAEKENLAVFSGSVISGTVSGLPVRPFKTRGYGVISCAAALVFSTSFLAFPTVFARIPMHSVGALLIVSAWQNVPYSLVSSAFKEKGALEIAAVILSVASFVVLRPSLAFLVLALFLFTVKAVRNGK